jgi:hypothetical protein
MQSEALIGENFGEKLLAFIENGRNWPIFRLFLTVKTQFGCQYPITIGGPAPLAPGFDSLRLKTAIFTPCPQRLSGFQAEF